jgi:hypothetical protein
MAEHDKSLTADELDDVRRRSAYALVREPVDTIKFAGMVASLEDVPRLLATVDAYREQSREAHEFMEQIAATDDNLSDAELVGQMRGQIRLARTLLAQSASEPERQEAMAENSAYRLTLEATCPECGGFVYSVSMGKPSDADVLTAVADSRQALTVHLASENHAQAMRDRAYRDWLHAEARRASELEGKE